MSTLRETMALWRRRFWIVRTLRGEARRWAIRRYMEDEDARASRLHAATLGNGGRVIFVCYGNIMRSAYATQVMRAKYPHMASRIAGAGTHAVPGRAAQNSAMVVSKEMGVSLDAHIATPVTELALSPHDVVICMDALNEANVLAAFPELEAQVFRVGDVESAVKKGAPRDEISSGETVAHADREVRDPYGRGDVNTRDAFERVARLTEVWMERLSTPA